MGYYVTYDLQDVIIDKDKEAACLAAINALHTDEMLLKYASGGGCPTEGKKVREYKWYGFTGNPPEGEGFKTLAGAIKEWRFVVERMPKEGLRLAEWVGEKMSQEDILFETIAPFVQPGGEIFAKGEDGEFWKYEFHDGKCFLLNGRPGYDDPILLKAKEQHARDREVINKMFSKKA